MPVLPTPISFTSTEHVDGFVASLSGFYPFYLYIDEVNKWNTR